MKRHASCSVAAFINCLAASRHAAFLAPQPQQCLFIGAHDDAGIRATDKFLANSRALLLILRFGSERRIRFALIDLDRTHRIPPRYCGLIIPAAVPMPH